MKLKRILTLCCMLTMALGMASSASAADYSFETSANPVYYGSTNYEDLYDAGYNYGARNQIDYDIPDIQSLRIHRSGHTGYRCSDRGY